MLLRCWLDPWDVVYYPLPFIVALLAWETTVAAPPAAARGAGDRRDLADLLATCRRTSAPTRRRCRSWSPRRSRSRALAAAVYRPPPLRAGARAARRAQSSTSSSFVKSLRICGAALADDDEVLDPHAELAGQVDRRARR